MITLTNTKYGTKRRAIWAGLNSFDLLTSDTLNMVYYVQCLDTNNNLLDDPSVNQNRKVIYPVGHQKRVDSQFNPLPEESPAWETAKTEFQYVTELAVTTPIPTIGELLGQKLAERGIFGL